MSHLEVVITVHAWSAIQQHQVDAPHLLLVQLCLASSAVREHKVAPEVMYACMQ